METRDKTKLYLIGSCVTELLGAKLPSNFQALGLFLHLHLEKKMDIQQAARKVIKEIMTFWDKARIPVKASQHSINKLKKLFQKSGPS